jgi:metal-responsive CopG/Arc/MetJ family transcriptional regulator
MKTAISLPDATFTAAEALAKRLGVSRSQLYRRALEKFINAERRSDVTDRLNKIYADESSGLDPALSEMQSASLPLEEW